MKIIGQKGFTVIEMIVSIGIIVVMTGLFLANYRTANQAAGLNAAAQKLASDIRLVQSYALGSKKDSTIIPAGGWGVYMQKNPPNDTKYVIFADNGLSAGSSVPYDYDGSDSVVQTVSIPGDGNISIFSFSGFSTGGNSQSVVFLPPSSKVYFSGDLAVGAVEIVLKDKRNNATKTVSINHFGLVEVN